MPPSPSPTGPRVSAYVLGHEVKGGLPESAHGQLGTCPGCLRVLLTLEEKGLPYNTNFINGRNTPAWLLEVSPTGALPVIKDLEQDQYIVGADSIADYLEDKFGPGKEMGKAALGKAAGLPQPGAQLAERYRAFAAARTPEAREALRAELSAVEAAVSNERPFCGGKDVNAWDLALSPMLYICRAVCRQLDGWELADEFPNIKAYLNRVTGRPAWRNSASWDQDSVREDIEEWAQEGKVAQA